MMTMLLCSSQSSQWSVAFPSSIKVGDLRVAAVCICGISQLSHSARDQIFWILAHEIYIDTLIDIQGSQHKSLILTSWR